MKLGYTIIYVEDVPKTVHFYEAAFGIKTRFIHESHEYAEMETGSTTLAFVSYELAHQNNVEFKRNDIKNLPAGFEIAFVSDNVAVAYQTAINNGASSLQLPHQKPWGQTVAYVRDLNGVLVEIASPM